MNIGKFSLRNSVLMNILMGALIVMGILSFNRVPKEEIPDLSFGWLFVSTVYPGVSAEDIEKSITIKIEEELQNVARIKKITSITRESLSFVQIEFEDGIPKGLLRKLYQDVRNEIDKIQFPTDAEDPLIQEFTTSDWVPIITVTVAGEGDPIWKNKVVRDLQTDLLRIDNVSKAEIIGGQEREVWTEVDRDRLQAYGISMNEVVSAIQNRQLSIPSGTVAGLQTNRTTRTVGEVERAKEIEDIIVRSTPNGVLRVRDVASVNGGLAEAESEVREMGKPGILINISKNAEGNAIRVADKVKKVVEKYREQYKGELEFIESGDSTTRIRDILSSLGSNAVFGIIFLFVTLLAFLGVRNSLITSLGIPVTFAITFIFMDYTGNSLNGPSTFALVLVLGMIVDHAIVIIENIYRHRQEGMGVEDAVITGTNEVVMPVIAATATTIAAFLPLMLLPGFMGAYLRIIPMVVCFALVASTFEALFFIPVHFAEWGSRVKEEGRIFVWLKRFFHRVISLLYRHKIMSMSAALIFMFMVMATAFSGKITVALFSDDVLPRVIIQVKLPLGATTDEVERVLSRYEEEMMQALPEGEINSISTRIGFIETETEWITEDNVGQVSIFLKDGEGELKRAVRDIRTDYEKRCAHIPGADQVSVIVYSGGPPVDKPIAIKVMGEDLTEMGAFSDTLQQLIMNMPKALLQRELDSATDKQRAAWEKKPESKPDPENAALPYNISDTYDRNSPEFIISVREQRAAELGLSVAEVGLFFRTAIAGTKAATFFAVDGEDLDVIVKFEEGDIRSAEDITSLMIPTRDGRMVPFEEVASVRPETGIVKIDHYKGERAITISADMDDKAMALKINKEIARLFEEELSGLFPGVALDLEGEFAEFNRIITDIVSLMFIGVFLLYVILGAQFKSYSQPVIMFFSIPFAVVGVILFLLVSGSNFTISVMYSMVALIGISVNDSIVLISFINHNRRVNGLSTSEAVISAATTRLRPIILTSVTTMGGLIPLAFGLGGYSPVWGPMASSIIFGLLFSTTGTLLIIPCMYGIFDAVISKLGGKMRLEGE